MKTPETVAVIDIGSNSIKVLVARLGRNCGRVKPVYQRPIDARISAGINRAEPRLSAAGMAAGLDAIKTLLREVEPHQPRHIQLVATSAVRDALNRDEFLGLVKNATGHAIRVLTGTEEANYIGRGLLADPALDDVDNFYVFDLGGGSLECLRFRDRTIEVAQSLPLGCVRLTERFVTDRETPVAGETIQAIEHYASDTLAASGFAFSLPPESPAIGTGGSLFTCRSVLAHKTGVSVESSSPFLSREDLSNLLAKVSAMPLEERRKLDGLPPARADVFPTALATLLAVIKAGALPGLHHSNYNLRYGIAAELLKG